MPLNNHDVEDISQYIKFPPEDMEKYFPKSCFGSYKYYEFDRSKTFGLMCTEEGLMLVNYLKQIMEYKNNPELIKTIKSQFLQCKDIKEVMTLLKDENVYSIIYHHFAINMIDSLNKHRGKILFQKLFHTSAFFDALVNMMVKELKNVEFKEFLLNDELRQDLCDQLMVFIDQNADHSNPNPLDIPYLLRILNQMTFKLPNDKTHKFVFQRYKKNYKKIPSTISNYGFPGFQGINSGILLHGVRGAGKSGVMLYTAMWAHKMNWIVVSVGSGYKWTQNDEYPLRRHNKTGLYMQPQYGVELLEQLKSGKNNVFSYIFVIFTDRIDKISFFLDFLKISCFY